MAVVGFWENVIGQTVALYKTPLDLLRGSGREEKVLKNANDACAAEALEVATYTAIERLARSVGDDETAMLAASILAEEEKILQRILREIPKLTAAVVDADVKGKPSYDVTAAGAAAAVRDAAERELPGVAAAAGALTSAVAIAQDLPIADYDKQTAHDIAAKLKGFSQRELRMIGAYEAKHENRWTITDRIAKLTGDERVARPSSSTPMACRLHSAGTRLLLKRPSRRRTRLLAQLERRVQGRTSERTTRMSQPALRMTEIAYASMTMSRGVVGGARSDSCFVLHHLSCRCRERRLENHGTT